MTSSEHTFRAAAARAGASDVDRLIVVDLQERRGRELFGFARHLGLTDEEARDASQEALLRLWKAIDAGKEIGQADAWTFRALYRICMDEHRWRRRVRGLTERLQRGAAASEGDKTDLIAVWDAVGRLPARQRLAIFLRYRADLPFDEVGAILGIAAASARSHVSRALDTLRERLSDEMETNR
ncbi:MAG: RNA polymerase sigma factor [Candidatus Limnocylindria bacterium]